MRMMKWLLAVAAAAVAAMVIYLLAIVGDEPPAGPASTRGTTDPAPSATASREGTTGAGSPPATPVAPEEKPAPAPVPAEPAAPPERRDHRGEGPTGTPSPIAPSTIAAVRKLVGPAVRSCAEATDVESQRIQVTVSARLRASGRLLSAQDVRVTGGEALGPGFVECVRKAYEELAAGVPTEATDGEDTVHMPWTVP
jgi:hypothetical protein